MSRLPQGCDEHGRSLPAATPTNALPADDHAEGLARGMLLSDGKPFRVT